MSRRGGRAGAVLVMGVLGSVLAADLMGVGWTQASYSIPGDTAGSAATGPGAGNPAGLSATSGLPGGPPAPGGTAPASPSPVPTAAPTGPLTQATAAPIRPTPPHVLVMARRPLPAGTAERVARLDRIAAVEVVDAARVEVAGSDTVVLGVDPSTFRPFTPGPTADSEPLWRNVSGGDIVVSLTMGKQARLPLGGTVPVGPQRVPTRVGAFATVGIGEVDAVVSRDTARRLNLPAGNALLISAAAADLRRLRAELVDLLPRGTHVELLNVVRRDAATGAGGQLSTGQVRTMFTEIRRQLGKPYVWGAEGPDSYDCSGLVQWVFAKAGVGMPRVAAQQFLTGPRVPPARATCSSGAPTRPLPVTSHTSRSTSAEG